jgi:hypothetical protein
MPTDIRVDESGLRNENGGILQSEALCSANDE